MNRDYINLKKVCGLCQFLRVNPIGIYVCRRESMLSGDVTREGTFMNEYDVACQHFSPKVWLEEERRMRFKVMKHEPIGHGIQGDEFDDKKVK